MKKIAPWLAIAGAILVVDQITKTLFNRSLEYGERIHVLPFFDFTLLYNPGAAFSFLADAAGWQRWFFTALGTIAAVVVIVMLKRHHSQRLFATALTLILGGAVGNVIDRIVYGHVVDFLLFYWNNWYFPAFNVADMAITCGAILLILDELLRMRRTRNAS
jgi:signal peptidase II